MKMEFIYNTIDLENDGCHVNCAEGFYYDIDEFCLDELQEYATAHGLTLNPVVFMGYVEDNLDFDLENSAFYGKTNKGYVYKFDTRYPIVREEKCQS